MGPSSVPGSLCGISLLIIVATLCPAACGRTIYVDDDATGIMNGTTWPDAYTCLQDALAAAQYGDQIRVAQGTYQPDRRSVTGRVSRHIIASGDRTGTFQLISGVTVEGGYAGLGQSDPDARDVRLYETILSGDLNGDDGSGLTNNSENSYHVVSGSGTDATAVLDGVTITGGNADDVKPYHAGGGMYNQAGSPTLIRCVFVANWGQSGGGMANDGQSHSTLTSCTFTDNAAESFGGAMYNLVSSPILSDCAFIGNSAGDGGGMVNWDDCTPTVRNCSFRENMADVSGGGMYNRGPGNPALVNCTFSGNSAGGAGGGMYNTLGSRPQITNCTFCGNSADDGGGVSNNKDSDVTLTNCTFAGNLARNGGGGIHCGYASPTVVNTILWADSPDEIVLRDSSITVVHSDVQGGWPGPGNINADPLFADADGADDVIGTADDNLRLLPGSPCIDAGDTGAVPEGVIVDLDGRPRIINSTVDMGAFEADAVPTGRTLYVDIDAPGNNDGSSWSDAYVCLQDALAAAESGDEIRVAAGVYRPDQRALIRREQLHIVSSGDWEATFHLINDVVIVGGFAGFGEPDPDARDVVLYASVLSGDLDGNDGPGFTNIWENSYHVVTASGTDVSAVLDGFAITGGNADGPFPHDRGGGMYSIDASPVLANCTFVANVTTGRGGGLYGINGKPMLLNCTFADNVADSRGGGMYSEQSGPTLTNCTFTGNSAGGGGGLYSEGGAVMLADCVLTGNSTTGSGGGVYNSSSNSIFLGCSFSANTASRSGGGMYNRYTSRPNLINCIFSGNSANYSGAMENLNTSWATLLNCTLSANAAIRTGGGIGNIQEGGADLINCILWGNSDETGTGAHSSQIRGQAVVRYSCVQDSLSGHPWPGEGNINADPCFAESGYWDSNGTPTDPGDDFWVDGDYHLKSQMGRWDSTSQSWVMDKTSSPCIDAGDRDTPVGLERFPNDNLVNMGAYGGTAEASLSPRGPRPVIGEASDPHPADGAVGVQGPVTLTWAPAPGAVAYNVYFGLDLSVVGQANVESPEGVLVAQGYSGLDLDLGELASGQTYYWRVDAVSSGGVIVAGKVWSFTTASSAPGRRR